MGVKSLAPNLARMACCRFIEKTYPIHIAASFALLYAFGGLPALVWGGALRTVWVYHVTWFVNSAAHVWGTQDYNTGLPPHLSAPPFPGPAVSLIPPEET